MVKFLLVVPFALQGILAARAMRDYQTDSSCEVEVGSNGHAALHKSKDDAETTGYCVDQRGVFSVALWVDRSNCYRVIHMLFFTATSDEMQRMLACDLIGYRVSSTAESFAESHAGPVEVYDCGGNAFRKFLFGAAVKNAALTAAAPAIATTGPLAVALVGGIAFAHTVYKAVATINQIDAHTEESAKAQKIIEDAQAKLAASEHQEILNGNVPLTQASWQLVLGLEDPLIKFLAAEEATNETKSNMDEVVRAIDMVADRLKGTEKKLCILTHWGQ